MNGKRQDRFVLRAIGIVLLSILWPATVTVGAAETKASPVAASSDWQSRIQEDIAAREYDITWQDRSAIADLPAGYQAPNRAHGFRTYFGDAGIRVVPREDQEPSWEWGLTLMRYGRPANEAPADGSRLSLNRNRIDNARGGIVEWYVNDRHGLEQGFTLASPPLSREGERSVNGTHDVHIDLALTGTLDPSFSADGQAIDFINHKAGGGATALRYSQLRVEDARGRTLPARMEGFAEAGMRGVRMVFDDRDAVYPVTVDPLATSPAWTAESNQANAQFGFSVAAAGDVNGDGYSDVIVGAVAYDNGQTNEGRAYVFLGSASGLAVSPAWTGESNQVGAQFGYSVATAGDVNGDGYSDVIVGANLYDNGQTNEGRAFVYLGSASGLSTSPAWIVESDKANGEFGASVATTGDVNGDGYSDVIVGAGNYDLVGAQDVGRAYVYLGSVSGLATSPAWIVEGDRSFTEFGVSVATAGDVNGDGYADVVVGADGITNGGRAYLYLGSASGLSTSPAWTAVNEQQSAYFGCSVATAGDVNGDGYSDVIVGAKFYDNGVTSEGRAYVYLGSGSGLAATPVWVVESDQFSAEFGRSVATAGDFNGDGYSDVIVGARFYQNGQTREGGTYLYFGCASGLATSPAWILERDQPQTSDSGISVAAAGDVNGDGYSDVIVGASGYSNGQAQEGRASVYLGFAWDPATSPGWTADGDQAGAELGISVATAGDVNGDGYSDVIVGADRYDNGQTDEGRAYVYLGSTTGLTTSPAWTAESDQGNANFGGAVATAGDVNGDGYSDVIVGAHNYDNGQTDEGRAYVYLGSASGLDPSPAWTAESDQANAAFGGSVATAGDVNGDGYSDVIVGAPLDDDGQTDEGRAYVYLGSSSGLATSPAWTAESDQASAVFGGSVATAGDVNGDGYSDVIVGASSYDNGQPDEGRAYVYLGSAPGLAVSPAWIGESNQFQASFGFSVATAGDVNGDGYSDVIVGAYAYHNGETDEGRAYVYLGSAFGLAASPPWTAESDQAGAHFGFAVATAGDVNDDGYSDVIVGAPLYDNGQTDEGRAYVYFGSASGLGTSPAWTAERDEALAVFGNSVATAGDVNGDGYSDVMVGATRHDNGQSDEGGVYVYYGNNGGGLSRVPRQMRADGAAPIDRLGRSDSETSFRLRAVGRTPAGRARVRLQAEVKPLGVAFDGTGLRQGPFLQTTPSATTVVLDETIAGLEPGRFYHWRLRTVSDSLLFPRSPWFSPPYNNRTETDLRTAGCRDADEDGRGAPPDPMCAAGAVADCNDTDGTSWSPADEARSLTLSHDWTTGVTTFTWLAPVDPGGTFALGYDLLRSLDPRDFRTAATCVETGGTDTTADDTSVPSTMSVYFYLVRAENGCPYSFGLGSIGAGSDHVPRTARTCP